MFSVHSQHLVHPVSFLLGEDWVGGKDVTSWAKNILLGCFYSAKLCCRKTWKKKIAYGLLREFAAIRYQLWFGESWAHKLSFFISFSTGPLLTITGKQLLDQEYTTMLTCLHLVTHKSSKTLPWQTSSLLSYNSDILPQYKLPEESGSEPQTQPLCFCRTPSLVPDYLIFVVMIPSFPRQPCLGTPQALSL